METWLVYALLATFFAGLTSVLAKFGLKNINADLGLAIRTTVVLIVVLLNVFAWKGIKDLAALSGKTILFLALSGLTTAFSWIFYYRAVKIGDVSMVASIDKGSIVLTILLSFLFLKEPMTPKLLVGGALILTGMIVLVWK
jgi:transporter family protein